MDLLYFPPLPVDRSLPDGWTLRIRYGGIDDYTLVIHGPWHDSSLRVNDLLQDVTSGVNACFEWPSISVLRMKSMEMLLNPNVTVLFRKDYVEQHKLTKKSLENAKLWPPHNLPTWLHEPIQANLSISFRFATSSNPCSSYRYCIHFAFDSMKLLMSYCLRVVSLSHSAEKLTIKQLTQLISILNVRLLPDLTMLIVSFLCDENRIVEYT